MRIYFKDILNTILCYAGLECVSHSEAVSSSYPHTSTSDLRLLDTTTSKSINNQQSATMHNGVTKSTGASKLALQNIELKHQNRGQVADMLSSFDQVRSRHVHQDPGAALRPNYSSLDVLCQIFPGRSRNSLESLLKV